MATQVDIVNRALLSIGARAQVSSINPSDGSTEADACAILFTPTFEMLARAAHWNCFRKQADLSLIKAAEGTPENPTGTTLPLAPFPWLYAYEYPFDCLKMRSIVASLPSTSGSVPLTGLNNQASTYLPKGSAIPFVVSYDTDLAGNPVTHILTNQSQAQAVYTVNQPNPAIWDSLFQGAMVESLAAYLVPALSLNMELLKVKVATSERLVAQARVSDGNEGVTVIDHTPDWIVARGGAPRQFGPTGYVNPLYEALVWPI